MMRRLASIVLLILRRTLVRLDPRRALDRRRVRSAAAERLGEALGRPVRWEKIRTLHGATARAEVEGGGEPSSVVLKQMASRRGEKRFDPSLDDPMALSYRLFAEWAALDLLEELTAESEGPAIAPRRVAGDRELGFVLVEDLAEGKTIARMLAGSDRQSAEKALLSSASLLGRMHGVTTGHRKRFEELRFALGPRTQTPERSKGHRRWFEQRVKDLRHALAELPLETTEAFWQEVDGVAAALDAGGELAALTHGDMAVDNLLLTGRGLHLIDFEFADYRLALTDAVYPRMIYPGCWLVRRLPAELIRRMEARYRKELVTHCPAAADDGRFNAALLAACATWMVSLLALSLHPLRSMMDFESVVEQDRPWGPITRRQIVVARLDAFVEACGELGGLPYMRGAFTVLAAHLRERWGELPDIPYFPVFDRKGSIDRQ